MDATKLSDVKLYIGTDCYREFFDDFDRPQRWKRLECFVYNLRYEFAWMLPFLSERYRWKETERDSRTMKKRAMEPGTWNCLEDAMTVYEVCVCNKDGCMLRIRDDLRRGSPQPMKSAAHAVRTEYPEWWEGLEEVKENVDELYNDWWTLPSCCFEFRRFIHYAKLDAYSQAMISRYYFEVMGNRKLTISSFAMDKALMMIFDDNLYFAKKKFIKAFPPLEREDQDLVEENVLGGFVYAVPGDHRGTFVHIDYSSSYPYEYAFGDLFCVPKCGIEKGAWSIYDDDSWIKWIVVSFDFELKETGVPLLQYGECLKQDFDPLCTAKSLKMREGKVVGKLMTKTYFEELKRHYDVTNEEITELWAAPLEVGKFRDFIKYCYEQKQRPELKGTMQRDIYKRMMNAGVHGKTITKTHRTKITYPKGERLISQEVNEASMLSLIGFTAMMNARERLARHCRVLQEAGIKVMQCDTDSIVARGSEEQVRKVLGEDAFYQEGNWRTELGRFEFEEFDGKNEFDRFKSWGLKRYCEIQDGKYRKSAFAGMHDEVQAELLPHAPVDGTVFRWMQKKSKQLKDSDFDVDMTIGRIVYRGEMKASLQDIYYTPRFTLDDWIARGRDMAESMRNREINEDMIAELMDDAYGEHDRHWKKHVKRSYERRKLQEMKDSEADGDG